MKIDIEWLEKTMFHRTLTTEEKKTLSEIITIEEYHKGETLIVEGQQGKGLYFLRAGRVSISTQSHGEKVRICEVSKGAQLGDFASFVDSKVSATVTSLDDTTVYHISNDVIEKLMQDRTELCWDLLINAVRSLSSIVHGMNKGNALARQSTYGRMS